MLLKVCIEIPRQGQVRGGITYADVNCNHRCVRCCYLDRILLRPKNTVDTERDFSLICDIESNVPIDSDIRAEIMDMRINIKEFRDRIRNQKNMLDKILNDYNRLKYSLLEIKRKL